MLAARQAPPLFFSDFQRSFFLRSIALAIAGLISQDAQMVRATYLAMELIGWFVIVPFSLASLLTGLVQSLGTEWGLFRHYWILVKFLLTIVSILILFGFTQTLGALGDLAANTTLSIDDLRNLGQSPVIHSGGGLLALLVTTTLSVYKPWGMTRHGRRKQHERRKVSQPIPPRRLTTTRDRGDTHMADLPSHPDSNDDTGVGPDRGSTTSTTWGLYVLLGIIGLVILFVVLHLAGGGLGGH